MNYNKIINQKFGQNYAFYNADCVFGMRNLPDESIDFYVYSPPFLALYIYSDSVADLGNTDSEAQFFEGYKFHLEEQYRTLKTGQYMAVHCKDTMRYMSSHGYAGLYDFPGEIIRLAESIGFTYQRWITVWKDPVIEMQKTKTYGLLHKSFRDRAEVTRQGCADYVIIFKKGGESPVEKLPPVNPQVIERMVQQWTNKEENIRTPLLQEIRNRPNSLCDLSYSFWNNEDYAQEFIEDLLKWTQPGRLTSIHCTAQMLRDIVRKFESVKGWKFHSRVALTDGSYIVTFRNWTGEFKNEVVKHSIKPPNVKDYQVFERVYEDGRKQEYWKEPVLKGNEYHPDYVGNQPPTGWRDANYYSILLWQRYTSPVWFDLEGLPETHKDSWMNIVQTNVLNYRQAKNNEEEKHICPLQLDLIEQLIYEYTEPGEVVCSSYGGIGSEPVTAIKCSRKAVAFELKPNYWKIGCKNCDNAEKEMLQERMMI